jgi:hypothetical protein
MMHTLLKGSMKHPCYTWDVTLIEDPHRTPRINVMQQLEKETKRSYFWDVMPHLLHLKSTDMFLQYVS